MTMLKTRITTNPENAKHGIPKGFEKEGLKDFLKYFAGQETEVIIPGIPNPRTHFLCDSEYIFKRADSPEEYGYCCHQIELD